MLSRSLSAVFGAAAFLASTVAPAEVIPVGTRSSRESGKSGARTLYTAQTALPHFKSEAPVPQLANRLLSQVRAAYLSEFKQSARGNAEFNQGEPYPLRMTGTIGVRERDLVSTVVSTETFSGGAHGMVFWQTVTVGMVDGVAKRLTIQDIFRGDAQAAVDAIVLPRLHAANAAWVVDGTLKTLAPNLANNFVVTPAGITWLFQPYEAGSYAEGTYQVKVPWQEMAAHLKSGALDPAMAAIDLTATYRERIAMTPDTTFEAGVASYSGPHAEHLSLVTVKPSGNPPYRPRLIVPKLQMKPDVPYAVYARLVRDNDPKWIVPEPTWIVAAKPIPTKLDLRLVQNTDR